jgi:hypothetical protein
VLVCATPALSGPLTWTFGIESSCFGGLVAVFALAVPEATETLAAPEEPWGPDAPGVPEEPDVPEAPDAPELPEAPEVPAGGLFFRAAGGT